MCLIVFSFNHPEYKLVVAANRDEFYSRRTAPAQFWEDQPSILAGRDLQAMGTWMGITREGRLAMVTNYRDLKNLKKDAPSRGKLVTDFLLEDDSPETYLKMVAENGRLYNGFNLIVGNPEALWYYSNYREGITRISEGIHGLSNHLLDTGWPKVTRARARMESILRKGVINPDEVFDTFYDNTPAADVLLPDTGVGLERERMLSPVFIKSADYGSRSTTLITITRKNRVLFTERVYTPPGYEYSTRSFEFDIIATPKKNV